MRLPGLIREHKANRQRRRLYRAVTTLPVESRQAMLAAMAEEELIAGAYTDRYGRVCPALAAHRRGARGGVGDFPRAWDEFAGVRRPRPATARELQILCAVLQESLDDPGAPERTEHVETPEPARASSLTK
jgi:hypothetical protein